MSKAVAKAVETIKAHSQEGQGCQATSLVSAPFLLATLRSARLIAEAMEKVTSDGVITIEENKTTAETYNESRRGYAV